MERAAAADMPATVDEVQRAFAFILRSTQQRPQTEAEVRARLERRETPEDVAEEALRRARAVGAVNDADFARGWVEDRGRRRGYGVARLRQELRRRQVPDSAIEDALGALEDRDELAVATELARQRAARMAPGVPAETVARRLAAFLTRRGYPPGVAQRAAISASGLDRSWD